MSKWDELSMAEKAEMMKVAVRQGITNLSDIKQRYNEFADKRNRFFVKVSCERKQRIYEKKNRDGHAVDTGTGFRILRGE